MYDYLKNPQFYTIPSAIQKKVVNAVRLQGKALSCHVTAVSGAMITVKFDLNDIYTLPQVTVPLFGPEYIRYPIKATDLGVVMPVDVSVSYTSGQGGGPPNLSAPASLEALYFMPLGNKNWFAVDPAQVDIYAPNGVRIHDQASGAVINVHPSAIDINVGATTWHMDGSTISATASTSIGLHSPSIILDGNLTQGESGTSYPAQLNGPLTVLGDVIAGGKSLINHIHSGVTTGGGDTGKPV